MRVLQFGNMSPRWTSRRRFLALCGASALTALGSSRNPSRSVQASPSPHDTIYREFSGGNLSGWRLALGDGIYAAPDEPPVSIEDIETRHEDVLSELRANVRKRRIMAHNITYFRQRDELALQYTHLFTCHFRLPYMPSVENTEENGQALDAAVFVWDGIDTRMDWGAAFQWGLNPRERFGELRVNIQEGVHAAGWEPVGYLTPDLEWHTFQIIVNYPLQTASLRIDEQSFPIDLVGIPKRWPATISAGVQVEAISMYPGTTLNGTLHRVQFRDWSWLWMDMKQQRLFLPTVLNTTQGVLRSGAFTSPSFREGMQMETPQPRKSKRLMNHRVPRCLISK
ncbi:MAG: hypothetical protein KatS3mg049_0711 [Caldilinea sp.]|nr:MAG: hypothetical protein KatS3mg049_0711 [Caldilinea sp.]